MRLELVGEAARQRVEAVRVGLVVGLLVGLLVLAVLAEVLVLVGVLLLHSYQSAAGLASLGAERDRQPMAHAGSDHGAGKSLLPVAGGNLLQRCRTFAQRCRRDHQLNSS